MKKNIIILLITLPSMLSAAFGQMVKPAYRQFFFNPYLHNPAFAGISGQAELNLVYKKQMTNFKGSPVTTGINLQLPTRNRVVVGLNIVSDRQVLLKDMSVLGTFAYIVPISKKESLRFGLSAGFGVNSLDLTAEELNTNDPAILNAAANKRYMNGNFGVVYTASGLKLGFALTELFSTDPFNNERFSEFSLSNLKNMLFSASYRFNLGRFEKFAMEPYVLYRQSPDGLQNAWEAASVFHFMDQIWSGMSYHQHRGIGLFFGFNVKEKLTFSYNYEFPPFQSEFSSFNSHELQMSFKLGKIKKPRLTRKSSSRGTRY